MAQWLTLTQNRQYLAVLHFGKDGSSDLAEQLSLIADDYNLIVELFKRPSGRGVDLSPVLQRLKQTAITTILLNFDNPKSLDSMAKALAQEDMLTDDYLYLISPDALPTDQRLSDVYQTEVDSSLDLLLKGSLVFDILDPFRLQQDDPFGKAWSELDASFVQRINNANPLPVDNEAYYQAPADYFQTHSPNHLTTFVYDAIIMLGIGACQVAAKEDVVVTREDLIVAMHNMTLSQGASGPITPFPEDHSYRDPNNMQIGLYNIRPLEPVNTTRKYQAVVTSIWHHEGTSWGETTITSIRYRDGTNQPPPILRHMENNYLSKGVRIGGFLILGVTWLINMGSMAAIHHYQYTDSVQRAQPFFLNLICVGSLITSGAILTLSWDENTTSHQLLSAMCMSSVWFFFTGHVLTCMALFSKLWRIDRVLQFRRQVVSERQVLGPLLALLALTLVILILWTTLDPWRWERTWISRVPPEIYGECQCNHFWAFLGPLMAILVVAESLAAWFAWRTSDVPEEFSDSNTVILAIIMHVQSWMIGVPILAVLQDSSADATYLARVLVIWIFSLSSVLVVVGPKILRAMTGDGIVEARRMPDSSTRRQHGQSRVHVSGVMVSTCSDEASSSLRRNRRNGGGGSSNANLLSSSFGSDAPAKVEVSSSLNSATAPDGSENLLHDPEQPDAAKDLQEGEP